MGQSTSTARHDQPVHGGIDVAKATLVLATTTGQRHTCPNTPAGHEEAIAFFAGHGVSLVGLESTGIYHQAVTEALRRAEVQVRVLHPRQVKACAQLHLKRAKSDPLDARLIARCTALLGDQEARPHDARLVPLAEHLTFIEQMDEDIARIKVRRDRFKNELLLAEMEQEIATKTARRREHRRLLLRAVRAHPDLARRLDLIRSIPGLGERTALTLVIRLPELGRLSREELASLLGVAPFVHESGTYKGERRTGGGRARARTALFAAANAAAQRWNPALKGLYERLKCQGKPHGVAMIACVRKLAIYANAVLARDEPWRDDPRPAT